jgi:hypothetical protein
MCTQLYPDAKFTNLVSRTPSTKFSMQLHNPHNDVDEIYTAVTRRIQGGYATRCRDFVQICFRHNFFKNYLQDLKIC